MIFGPVLSNNMLHACELNGSVNFLQSCRTGGVQLWWKVCTFFFVWKHMRSPFTRWFHIRKFWDFPAKLRDAINVHIISTNYFNSHPLLWKKRSKQEELESELPKNSSFLNFCSWWALMKNNVCQFWSLRLSLVLPVLIYTSSLKHITFYNARIVCWRFLSKLTHGTPPSDLTKGCIPKLSHDKGWHLRALKAICWPISDQLRRLFSKIPKLATLRSLFCVLVLACLDLTIVWSIIMRFVAMCVFHCYMNGACWFVPTSQPRVHN